MASRNRKEGSAEEPVLSLQLDSSTAGLEPREVDGDSIGGFQTPCTLKGLSAGASGGALGFVFGFGTQQSVGRGSLPGLGDLPRLPAGLLHTPLSPPPMLGGYWFSQRLKGNLRGSLAEGWGSAKVRVLLWWAPDS